MPVTFAVENRVRIPQQDRDTGSVFCNQVQRDSSHESVQSGSDRPNYFSHLAQLSKELSVKKNLIAVGLLMLAIGVAQAQKLTGAGATFPYPIYSKWFSEYSASHPGVEVNYQSIGSGGGIRQVTAGLVDFGASDMPMTDEMMASSKVKLVHVPTVLGAVVPIYNVPGASDVRFS